jgi:hypothetical protein
MTKPLKFILNEKLLRRSFIQGLIKRFRSRYVVQLTDLITWGFEEKFTLHADLASVLFKHSERMKVPHKLWGKLLKNKLVCRNHCREIAAGVYYTFSEELPSNRSETRQNDPSHSQTELFHFTYTTYYYYYLFTCFETVQTIFLDVYFLLGC